ncbi:hypothetical protein TSA66_21075 [Noviherbaspirillum autotrophicum]|uniref:Uncharacterized protein n=1 Tax=Noviherbaspirillum autotrophicum TaxID=709839 RepID=A0A0C2BNB5_9BURK|nr:hypothetical protein TSA66_21075 [Noviherbaspirillum autotrophicum]
MPFTFGQVFAQGAVAATDSLVGTLSDGSTIALQVDVKAKHADGSVRHAIISGVAPKLTAGQIQSIRLVKGATASSATATTPTTLLNAGFTASVNLTVGGQVYTASADSLLKSTYSTWLSGPIAGEWLVSAPLKNAQGVAHPHLTARFAIRSYAGLNKARVDVTIENDWAYEPSPQNFTYDAQVLVGGQTAYSKSALTHFHHSRWHKQFWWGTAPQVNLSHNGAYLMASKAVPNYDPTVRISESGLADLNNKWTSSSIGPMGVGILNPGMPTAGGRPDIGPLPQWTAMYLISMDSRAKTVTLGTGDLAGSWPIHYRDKNTNRPVSIADYPYMTLLGNPGDTVNPATGKSEAFPACGGDCSTAPYNYNPDSAHQPSLAYVPYLTTGDYYYLEELQFWANWIMIRYNPYYRNFASGTLQQDEIRGQAWSLRTLGQTAYITPDSDPMKQYFVDRVNNNLNWYNTTYTNAASANKLGVIDGSGQYASGATAYTTPSGPGTGLSPWQDDFFTWAAGYLSDLGFTNATPLLKWKATFPVGRMTATGFCWIDGAAYSLSVRPSATSPLFTTLADVYQSTMRNSDGTALKNSTGALYLSQPCNSQAQADWRTQKERDNGSGYTWSVGEMDGWAWSSEGYPSNMQPALAVAATSGVPNAQTAWNTFINRTVKPDYSVAPQWAIVPRF